MHMDAARLHARCKSSIGMLMFLALLALGSMALNSSSRSLWMVSTREEAVAGSTASCCSDGGGWAIGAILRSWLFVSMGFRTGA